MKENTKWLRIHWSVCCFIRLSTSSAFCCSYLVCLDIIGWFSSRTGTSVDDGKARRKDWTRLPVPDLPPAPCHWSSQLFNLRAPSSTYVPVLLLNQPNNVGVSSFLTPLAGVFLLKGSPSLQCLVSASSSWYGQTSINGHLSTTATSLQRSFFLVDSSYIHSCFNLSGMLNFFCLQGGRCREVQLYLTFKLLYLPEYNVKNYADTPP